MRERSAKVESILAALDEATRTGSTGQAAPAGCYLDEDFHAAELDLVLRRGWHIVARHDDLPTHGDYRSIDHFGEPLLLVRDEHDRLRCFSRICLHRAFPIASGEGNAKRLSCPYHRWTYDTDGALVAAPLMDEVEDFELAACRLHEFPLEWWQGFAFVNLDADADTLVPQLRPLDTLLADYDVGHYVHVGLLEFDSPWNWKVLVDNFMESYHHLGGHAKTLQPIFPARGTHALDVGSGPFSVLENPAIEGVSGFWVFQIFPASLLAVVRGENPSAAWYEMQIDRHDHFHLRIHVLLPPESAADPQQVAEHRDFLDIIHHEDIPMCDGVMAGLRSSFWKSAGLSRQEALLPHFYRWLVDAMRKA